jgi:hypothetical protein
MRNKRRRRKFALEDFMYTTQVLMKILHLSLSTSHDDLFLTRFSFLYHGDSLSAYLFSVSNVLNIYMSIFPCVCFFCLPGFLSQNTLQPHLYRQYLAVIVSVTSSSQCIASRNVSQILHGRLCHSNTVSETLYHISNQRISLSLCQYLAFILA